MAEKKDNQKKDSQKNEAPQKKDDQRTNLGNVVKSMDTSVAPSEDAGISEEQFQLFMLNLQREENAQIAADERLKKAKEILLAGEFKTRLEEIEKYSGTEKEKATLMHQFNKDLIVAQMELAQELEMNNYKYSDKATKRKAKEEQKATLEKGKLEAKNRLLAIASDTSQRLHKIKEEREYTDAVLNSNTQQIECEQKRRNLTNEILKEKRKDGRLTVAELQEQFGVISETYEEERKGHEENIAFINERLESLKELQESAVQSEGLPNPQIEDEIKRLEQEKEKEKGAAQEADKNRFKEEAKDNIMLGAVKGLQNSVKVFSEKVSAAVDNAIDMVGQHKASIDAGLQGTQSSYDDVAAVLKRRLAISPFVKQTEVLQKLNDAVDKGIAYNVEQRAFLATMTDKIVSTFDAFDSNLMRIIRLQQADTTAARMGMEANLLQFFNSTFSDHSYLQEGYDDVSKALVDANAQMTRDMSISFEFNVQKWMGSLASLGFSTETISTIAQGINYLGSGNVAALASDTELQSLLAMSASRAGLSYSQMLVDGIDDKQTNTLLKAMVEYLKEIAEGENNAVVKAAYGDVFHFTQADLRAIDNLNKSDITNIANQTMSYSKAMSETQSQLVQVIGRLSPTQMMDTVFDNFMYTAAESLASNPVTALMYKTLSVIEEVTGGIEIPFVNAMGFGLDLNMSMESLLKTGIFGLNVIGNVPKMINSLIGGGGLNLDMWKFDEYTKRGGNFEPPKKGVQTTTSGSQAVTSSSSSDTKKQAIATTEEDQEMQKKKSKEEQSKAITVETVYKEIFDKKSPMYTLDTPVKNNVITVVEHLDVAVPKIIAIDRTTETILDDGVPKVKSIDKTTESIDTTVQNIYEKNTDTLSAVSTNTETTASYAHTMSSTLSETSSVISTISTNVAELKRGMSVNIGNFGDLTLPSSPDTVSLSSSTLNTLVSGIKAAILGGENNNFHKYRDDYEDDEVHTITDLVHLLSYGTLRVHDEDLSDELKKLNADLI